MANEPLQFTQAIAAIFNVTQAFAGSTELDAVSAGVQQAVEFGLAFAHYSDGLVILLTITTAISPFN